LGGDFGLGVGLESVLGGSCAGGVLLGVELGDGVVANENSGLVLVDVSMMYHGKDFYGD
jgi:hypothetical protein